jgi:hypothetical protein
MFKDKESNKFVSLIYDLTISMKLCDIQEHILQEEFPSSKIVTQLFGFYNLISDLGCKLHSFAPLSTTP